MNNPVSNRPIRYHILIGIPGSGKTTFARQWCDDDPTCCHISTDRIRASLYGDAAEQGDWGEILTEILAQAKDAILADRSILYDATNAQRSHRREIVRQLRQQAQHLALDRPICVHGWQLTTTLDECHRRNRHRDRTIPADIIDAMHASLCEDPPTLDEGFTSLHVLPAPSSDTDRWDLDTMQPIIRP
jgi:predicted kinase